MLQQRRNQVVHRLFADDVIIVQYQDQIAFQRIQLIQETAGNDGQGGQVDARQKRLGRRQGVRKNALHRAQEVGQEHAEIIIVLVQRQPGTRAIADFQPGAQQRALAETGRRGDQDQRAIPTAIQPFLQAWAVHQVCGQARPVELRVQQDLEVNTSAHGGLRQLGAPYSGSMQRVGRLGRTLLQADYSRQSAWLQLCVLNRLVRCLDYANGKKSEKPHR